MKKLVSSLLTPLAVFVFTLSVAKSVWIIATEWEQVVCELELLRHSK